MKKKNNNAEVFIKRCDYTKYTKTEKTFCGNNSTCRSDL